MRTLYFYIPETLADWEPAHVIAELCSGRYLKDRSLRYNVVLCGLTMDSVTTMGGLHLQPDTRISDIRPGGDDLVLLPGADTWLDPSQEPVPEKIREILKSGVTVAAICGATLGLANAGLLNDRPHTSNDLGAMKEFCPRYRGSRFYRNEPAVSDDNLITATGLAPVEFAYHTFRRLDVMRQATLEAWFGLFTQRKPEYFYALMESLTDTRT